VYLFAVFGVRDVIVRDVAELVVAFALVMWLLFRFASR